MSSPPISVLAKLNNGTIGMIVETSGDEVFNQGQNYGDITYFNLGIDHLEGATHDSNMSHFDGFGNKIDANQSGVGWSGYWATNGNVSQQLGGLEFTNMNVADDVNRTQVAAGGDLTRDLRTSPIDLDATQDYFVSLFVRSDDDGSDSGSQEFLDIDLLSGGATAIALGSGSGEAFFINPNGSPSISSASNTVAIDTTYFLLAKIAASDTGDDEISLAWYDDVNAIPADVGSVVWRLTQTADLSDLIDSISLTGGTNATWNADALRIGTTFDSVLFTDGAVPVILGNLNADGLINLDDWITFKANMGSDTPALTFPDREDTGDLDVSGIIDLDDFVIFRDQYELFNGAGAFTALDASAPEPNSVFLLVMGALGLLRRW